jgi:hypothetical protein
MLFFSVNIWLMLSVCNCYGKFTGTPDNSKFYITFFLDTIFYILKMKK